MVHNIRITFGAQTQPQIDIQQGDYNSRTIQALCYTSSGGAMFFDGQTVSVVYSISGTVSAEYPVQVNGNVLSFTLPGLASASVGTGSMQVRIYGSESLLQSAIIPYVVKASLDPGPAEEDQVPMLVMLVQQAQQAIAECTAATDKANETVADIEQKLADGAFIGPTGPTGPQGYQGIGVTSASLDDQGELVFTVTDPATGGSSALPPVNIDTSAAIQSVNQAAQEGVKQVQSARASAISAVDQAGKNAGTQAVSEVYSAKDTAIADIATVKSGAESAITAAQQSAVQTVQQSGTTAVGQVQKAQNTATTAIAQAQQNASTAVENEGDAQVQRLQEIIPQPTADNNGMVVAVQSGAYQLENPAGLVLNDGVITSKNGWSSMQIVKTLCPPFTVSGATVQCTPVANYPLGVQVAITPTQEGTGDPSPENVRPIVGLDNVRATLCGKNIWNFQLASNKSGWLIPFLPKGIYVFSILNVIDWWTENENGKQWYLRNIENTEVIAPVNFVNTAVGKRAYATFSVPYSGAFRMNSYISYISNYVQDIQLELGSTPTAYEPYLPGTTATLTLPQTIYGGTLDAVTGVGSEEWEVMEFDGTEKWETWGVDNFIIGLTGFYYYAEIPAVADSADYLACSHLVYNSESYGGRVVGFRVNLKGEKYWILSVPNEILSNTESSTAAVDSWKSYLAAQAAAGTPVTIAYKLATPQPIQATGNQPIPALPGTNTIYADAGDITVTGASDPIATITALQDRVSALESAQTNL